MGFKENLKSKMAIEKEKLAKMTFSQKAEYIFAYYKLEIFALLAVILIIVWSINHALTYTTPVLYGDVINSTFINDDAEEKITEYCGMGKHETCEIATGLASEVDVSSGSVYNQIDIYTVAGSMDFEFTDEAGAEYLCGLGTPLDLTKELPADLLELWSDRIVDMDVYDSNTESDMITTPAAVDISGTKVAEYFGLTGETQYLLITDLSGNEEYMQKFLEMLYEIETGAIE